jgi:hypothetical protein
MTMEAGSRHPHASDIWRASARSRSVSRTNFDTETDYIRHPKLYWIHPEFEENPFGEQFHDDNVVTADGVQSDSSSRG